jgi:aminotransferase
MLSKLNPVISNMDVYASKTISQMAKSYPDILNLSIGEPEFGPPEYLISEIGDNDLFLPNFLDSVKRYEQSRGSLDLRHSIANWYERRYMLNVDPEREIIVTHGGVEAIALAILCTTQTGDTVAITDPSYMLYERSVSALGRVPMAIKRSHEEKEYLSAFETLKELGNARTIVINSPENPTGYMLDKTEWQLISHLSERNGVWVIHDEVYDTMSFGLEHTPARAVEGLSERAILVNSCSKKFGTPGLRIGWLVANEKVIEVASKVHDYLYLGVNILYERIAERMLKDPRIESWLVSNALMLKERADHAMSALNSVGGYAWPRIPMGGMFLFPNVRQLYNKIPEIYKSKQVSIGEAIASYLVHEKRVATVPGSVYGQEGTEHIRLVMCSSSNVFNQAIDRLATCEK